MATSVLIIVIITLVGNLAILFLPFGKMEKAALSGVVGIVLIVGAVASNAATGEMPFVIREKIAKAPTPEAKQFLTARFNITEAEPENKAAAETPTPIELGVSCLVGLALTLTVVLLAAVRECDDKTAKAANSAALALNVTATGFLLSLVYGLQLSLVAWIKKTPGALENPSTEDLTQKTVST